MTHSLIEVLTAWSIIVTIDLAVASMFIYIAKDKK